MQAISTLHQRFPMEVGRIVRQELTPDNVTVDTPVELLAMAGQFERSLGQLSPLGIEAMLLSEPERLKQFLPLHLASRLESERANAREALVTLLRLADRENGTVQSAARDIIGSLLQKDRKALQEAAARYFEEAQQLAGLSDHPLMTAYESQERYENPAGFRRILARRIMPGIMALDRSHGRELPGEIRQLAERANTGDVRSINDLLAMAYAPSGKVREIVGGLIISMLRHQPEIGSARCRVMMRLLDPQLCQKFGATTLPVIAYGSLLHGAESEHADKDCVLLARKLLRHGVPDRNRSGSGLLRNQELERFASFGDWLRLDRPFTLSELEVTAQEADTSKLLLLGNLPFRYDGENGELQMVVKEHLAKCRSDNRLKVVTLWGETAPEATLLMLGDKALVLRVPGPKDDPLLAKDRSLDEVCAFLEDFRSGPGGFSAISRELIPLDIPGLSRDLRQDFLAPLLAGTYRENAVTNFAVNEGLSELREEERQRLKDDYRQRTGRKQKRGGERSSIGRGEHGDRELPDTFSQRPIALRHPTEIVGELKSWLRGLTGQERKEEHDRMLTRVATRALVRYAEPPRDPLMLGRMG